MGAESVAITNLSKVRAVVVLRAAAAQLLIHRSTPLSTFQVLTAVSV
jgi:hypothetical protein